MIVDREEMVRIEQDSQFSESQLMETAGRAVADELMHLMNKGDRLLILAGNGNNGGDAYTAAQYLKNNLKIRIFPVLGKPGKEVSEARYALLEPALFIERKDFERELEEADAVLDGVFGFSFHGNLSEQLADIFDKVNGSGKKVYSIDINSGAECDSGFYDEHALHSEITFALDCYKPFHMLRKEHQLFKKVQLLSLGLKHPDCSKWQEMNEELFFRHFPSKPENAYKGTYGKTLLIGGSYGMAGALSLNIKGAETTGAPYIEAALTHDIYPIEAGRHIRTVFHPFGHDDYARILKPVIENAAACAFGSGAVNMDRKKDILDLVLQYSKGPVVLDAEALNLLVQNTWVLRFASSPVVITPHIGEFSRLINKPVTEIRKHRIAFAREFAAKNNVIVVLKGSNSVVAAPDGRCFINQSGNSALAQAGSGDLLTGIIAGMLTMVKDVFEAVCMAVWLHGHIADEGLKIHSRQNFPLEEYPALMDQIFRKKGY